MEHEPNLAAGLLGLVMLFVMMLVGGALYFPLALAFSATGKETQGQRGVID